MDLKLHEYKIRVNGLDIQVTGHDLGHALRKLGDVHWDENDRIEILNQSEDGGDLK